jgi:lysophospholipase L1-like esterase
MKNSICLFILAIGLVASAASAQPGDTQKRIETALKEYRDHSSTHTEPTGRFETGIQATLAADRISSPPKRAILFIGSSIFKQWTSVTQDMAPLPVFNRAFGGSRTSDILERVDQLVLPHEPKVIVYYGGGNDINNREPAAAVFGRIHDFERRVRAKLPGTRIIFVAIDRAPSRRDRSGEVDAANALIRDYCSVTPGLTFVDLNPITHDEKDEARPGLYRDDKLHFNPAAYVEFTKVIKPVLEKTWAEANAAPR